MYTSVSGRQDSALSRRGRQRGRLPRGRKRQDHQGGAHLELMGAEGEQRYNISNPRRCTCVQSSRLVYTVPLINEIDQITVVSHSVHILTYCGASARSSSDLVLLHSTMQVLTRYS